MLISVASFCVILSANRDVLPFILVYAHSKNYYLWVVNWLYFWMWSLSTIWKNFYRMINFSLIPFKCHFPVERALCLHSAYMHLFFETCIVMCGGFVFVWWWLFFIPTSPLFPLLFAPMHSYLLIMEFLQWWLRYTLNFVGVSCVSCLIFSNAVIYVIYYKLPGRTEHYSFYMNNL